MWRFLLTRQRWDIVSVEHATKKKEKKKKKENVIKKRRRHACGKDATSPTQPVAFHRSPLHLFFFLSFFCVKKMIFLNIFLSVVFFFFSSFCSDGGRRSSAIPPFPHFSSGPPLCPTVRLVFLGFSWLLLGCWQAVPSFIVFYLVLPSFTGFYLVLLGF